MKRKKLTDWQQLIEQQQTSGLSIVAFCKQQQLTTSSFYKYRARLQDKTPKPKLVKVAIGNTNQMLGTITLNHHNTQLTLPSCCEPQWLADLMKALNT